MALRRRRKVDPVDLLPMGWRMAKQVLRKVDLDGLYKADGANKTPVAVPLHKMMDANLITSEVENTSGLLHKVLLDIDVPAELIPSTTPGHSHLYIDVDVSVEKYMKLLDALAAAGVIEPGYAGASKARGYTALRLPWVKKGKS